METILTSQGRPFHLSDLESNALVIQTWSQSVKVVWEDDKEE